MIRHGRARREWTPLWPLVPGVLVGMTVGVVVFSKLWEVTR